MTQLLLNKDIDKLSDTELMKLERQIARKYLGKLSIPMVIWPLANTTIWLALWPLVLTGMVPPWAGFLIATVNITLSYLPSHDAQHDCYARPGEKLRWLNQFIGHYSLIPLGRCFNIMKLTHMEHHKNANNPALDPDYHHSKGQSWSEALWLNLQSFQPGSKSADSYGKCLKRIGTDEAGKAYLQQVCFSVLQLAVYISCAAYGYALEALLIWWLPHKIGAVYLQIYLSWLPHYPTKDTGRYRDTREFGSWLGVWSSLGMTAHIVHHLHPRIPLDKTPAALRELYPVLKARDCDLAKHIAG